MRIEHRNATRITLHNATNTPIILPSLGQLKAEQAVDANRHEGEGKELALVEPDEVLHVQFPRFLHLFEILYKEAEGEEWW